VIETYTVACDKTGPVTGIVVGRLEDGRRFIANTPSERQLLKDFMSAEQLGRCGTVSSQEGTNLFLPL
jgi:acetyl-CoA C-acetyltransferase